MSNLDLYNYEKRYARKYAEFENSNINNNNKRVIKLLLLQLQIEGLSWNRKFKYLVNLQKLAGMMNADFDAADEDAIIQLLVKISMCRPYMRQIYMITLKRLYNFLNKKTITDMIHIKFLRSNITPDMLIKPEELEGLDRHSESEKEALTYVIMDEAGLRPGELLKLHRTKIVFDDRGAKLFPDDKTGPRTVRIVKCANRLRAFLEKSKDEYPFLLPVHKFERRLKATALRAGITRRIWAYLFRHTNFTRWKGKLPADLLEMRYGWVKGSRMPAVYAHSSDSDLDDATCRAYTIEHQLHYQRPLSAFASPRYFSGHQSIVKTAIPR
jgi:integrase